MTDDRCDVEYKGWAALTNITTAEVQGYKRKGSGSLKDFVLAQLFLN
jgi:hypothetical protein